MTIARYRRYACLLPALVALIVYSFTVCRSIWIGDGAEFALALKTLGICHPPGYPLFTITGSVFVQAFFFLRPVFAANLFNVLVSASLVAVLFSVFRRDLSASLAAVASLLWSFMPLFWSQAVGVEIYNLNLLMITLTILVLESRATWRWPLTFYLLGLCLAGHPASLAVVPAVLFYRIRERELRDLKRLWIYVGFTMLAGTIYFYLWVRSAQGPLSDWGHPVGVSALWQHMSLKQYSGWVSESWGSLLETLKLYVRSLIESWSWLGVVAALSGTYLGLRAKPTRTIAALLMLATSLILAAIHQVVDFAVFNLVPMLATLLLIANNLIWLQERRIRPIIILTGGAVAIAAMLIFHYEENDASSYRLYEDYSRLLLDTADRGVLFTAGDINSFGAIYLRYAENYRPGVEVYDRSIRRQALLEKARQLSGRSYDDYFAARAAIFQYDRQPQFFAKNHYFLESEWLPGSDSLFSYGILYSLTQPQPPQAVLPSYPRNYDPGDLMSRELLANIDLVRGGEKLLTLPPDSLGAVAEFQSAINRMANEPRGHLLKLVGIYLRRIGFGDLALEAYQKALSKPILSGDQRREILFSISNVYKDCGNAAHQRADFAAAVANYIEALWYDSANKQLLLNVGLIYAQNLSDSAKALAYLSKYLELEPSDTRVRNLVNSLR